MSHCVSVSRFPSARVITHTPSWVIATLASLLTVLLFAASSEACQHWFIIPVFVCGVLTGIDVLDWLRGRVDTFDPVGMTGIVTSFTLFVTPLLHVKWDVWMWEAVPPADWRDWVGRMAILNVVGLLVYRTVREYLNACGPRGRASDWVWRPHPQAFWIVTAVTLGMTGVLQMWVFRLYGGISGYIDTFHDQSVRAFDGMGWIFMISESFPIILMLGFIVYMTGRPRRQTWLTWAIFMLCFFLLRMVFGGLRGSRLSTVVALFWAAGAIHLMVRPIPKRLIAIGCVGLVAFMYAYLAYKDGAGLTDVFAQEERDRLQQVHHRSLKGVLLGDLGRTDVQAYVLYKLMSDPHDFRYPWGQTYVAAASLLVPRMLLPERPAGKVIFGTDLIDGPGAYVPDIIAATRIYGLAGEAMINFTPLAVPLAYAIMAFVVVLVQRFMRGLHSGDLRLFLIPYLVYLCIWMFISDSDNVVYSLVTNALIPVLVIASSSRRVRVADQQRDFAVSAAAGVSSQAL